ncbi:L-asparaginase isoform 1 [Galdieria sulphuraria]|uniref:L-asparaginase isoform 1 n=1 Tax=Galdieria sulphuraria TaxID=130081 RepID=M2WUA4_GALSU|nr:L-asparaginase isoform 1 [Galdieria sulphuraria]EME27495.1 L-asparaginase isoform 1 [Galdieria sulphuraria]|eukprot:XP_005704015.1 L-asparaginase isoform 1 [Galdieria sulphuraria]
MVVTTLENVGRHTTYRASYQVDFPCIIVHGGAWNIPQNRTQHTLQAVQSAAKRGLEKLLEKPQNGATPSSCIEAVECAVCYLENDAMFDAGFGSCLCANGSVEMDALIMDGSTLRSGAVACVSRVRNPITLAKAVMEKTPHCLVVGQGAELLAQELNIPMVDSPLEMVSDVALKEWESIHNNYPGAVDTLFLQGGDFHSHETVGAVAIDSLGNIACATSTGGITGKRNGRVGDSPLIGCGGYSDSRWGGVSVTGHGESLMKVTLSRRIIFGLESGQEPLVAVENSLEEMLERVGGKGGAILLTRQGKAAIGFTTSRMAWALCSPLVSQSGIDGH